MQDEIEEPKEQISPDRVVELSKLYLEMALNDEFPEQVQDSAADTVHALAELERLRQSAASQAVSVAALLPDEAKKPLERNQVLMIARGLLRPNQGIVQRLAIEVCNSKGWS